MRTAEDINTEALKILEHEPAINLHQYPINIGWQDECLVLEGEVGDIVAKRRIPHLLSTMAGVKEILNHLRVKPSEHRGDGAILDSLYESLSLEPAFRGYPILVKGEQQRAGTAFGSSANNMIEISVSDAVVTLDGAVGSLTHKRLADVLAWWVIGAADVKNHLHVVPPEQNTDDEITDALRIVLEKDPWLDTGQIRPHTHDKKVFLDGLVHSQEQKHMAECDAWLILGVHDVINRIEVRP
jgi:osmotically-inducible protein OsmY